MTRERLRQFDSLLCELEEERERFIREKQRAERIEREYGVGGLSGSGRLGAVRAGVEALSGRREDELAEIRLWVDGIRDSLTRRAFKLRYLDGLPWDEVARRMGYAGGSGPRMLCERYMAGEEKRT